MSSLSKPASIRGRLIEDSPYTADQIADLGYYLRVPTSWPRAPPDEAKTLGAPSASPASVDGSQRNSASLAEGGRPAYPSLVRSGYGRLETPKWTGRSDHFRLQGGAVMVAKRKKGDNGAIKLVIDRCHSANFKPKVRRSSILSYLKVPTV
jgi:hypothetical protein